MLHSLKNLNKPDPEFAEDIAALLQGRKHGHMGKWEYETAQYPGDAAGGGSFWAALMMNPQNYYLPYEDATNIQSTVRRADVKEILASVDTIIELGPGCQSALQNKTIPFLNSIQNLRHYHAIDATTDLASSSAEYIGKNFSITSSYDIIDYTNDAIVQKARGKSAIIYWGGSIGNFSGAAGENPFKKLVAQLHLFCRGLKSGDHIFMSFDATHEKTKVLKAYKETNLARSILSVLYKARRDGILSNGFNPYMWDYEPVWVEQTGQCCHTIFPVVNQLFELNGSQIFIKEGTRFVSNNSYKYLPEAMNAAANMAGFSSIKIIQYNSMAVLIAEKP